MTKKHQSNIIGQNSGNDRTYYVYTRIKNMNLPENRSFTTKNEMVHINRLGILQCF